MAELIAAGEVIDRPASACKELVENAIDAGARKITVELRGGGAQYLRVTDDGDGIAPGEVPAAFLRHATSKLRTAEDLQSICTMGFRGEALASIAAMARVELFTRVPGAERGLRYRIEGGEEREKSEAGCPAGTTLIVRDLFYNTPARMKFLKKDVTEAGAVAAVLDHMAVSHPEVAFTLIRDGKTTLQTPGNCKPGDAVYAVYGREFFHTLTALDYDAGGVRAVGFVCRPQLGRGNRGMQHFFVNGRFIRSKLLTAALEQGYRESMMKGKFPCCVLDVRLPPSVYDINVHPAKLEVRFADEKRVFDAVYYGVKSALLRLEPQGVAARLPGTASVPPEPPAREPDRARADSGPDAQTTLLPPHPEAPPPGAPDPADFALSRPPKPLEPVLRQDFAQTPEALEVDPASYQSLPGRTPLHDLLAAAGEDFRARVSGTAPAPEAPMAGSAAAKPPRLPADAHTAGEADAAGGERPGRFAGARLIGELLRTYLLLECDAQLILIDKHAAHERLLYERMKSARRIERQVLLAPVPVTLPKEQCAALIAGRETAERLGFALEDFGDGCVLIREIPTMLPLEDAPESVAGLAAQLESGARADRIERLDALYHSMACKAAIKAHDRNDPLELQALLRLLDEHEEVRFCPHGRPIAVALTAAQIERMFGRRA